MLDKPVEFGGSVINTQKKFTDKELYTFSPFCV